MEEQSLMLRPGLEDSKRAVLFMVATGLALGTLPQWARGAPSSALPLG